MQLNGTEVRYGLQSSVDLSSVNTIGTAQLGTPSSAFPYVVAPNVAYSLVLEIEPGDTLTLDTTTGNITGAAGDTRAYRIDGMTWNSTDIEGQALPLVPSICGVLVRCSTPGAIVTVTAGGEDTIITAPAINLTASAEGRHPWSVEDVTFTADAAGSAAVVVIDIHASSAAIELTDPPVNDQLNIAGTLTPSAAGVLTFAGYSSGRMLFTTDGMETVPDLGVWIRTRWTGSSWNISYWSDGNISAGGWSSTEDVASPELVGTWTTAGGATGTPVVTITPNDSATYIGQPAIVDGTDIYRALTINPTTWSAKLN